MFKAKLIENKKYYKFRSKHQFLILLSSIPMALFAIFYQIQSWIIVVVIALYITMIILMRNNQKEMSAALGNILIEIDIDEVRLRSDKGLEKEAIKLNEVDRIILNDEYSIPQETIKEVGQELSGNTKKNFLILDKDGKKKQFDFEVDSYYMINQLNKLIEIWKTKGYNIERINQLKK